MSTTSWNTKYRSHAQLMNSLEEIVADLDLRHCGLFDWSD